MPATVASRKTIKQQIRPEFPNGLAISRRRFFLPLADESLPQGNVVFQALQTFQKMQRRIGAYVVQSVDPLRPNGAFAAGDKRDPGDPCVVELGGWLVEMARAGKISHGKNDIDIRIIVPAIRRADFEMQPGANLKFLLKFLALNFRSEVLRIAEIGKGLETVASGGAARNQIRLRPVRHENRVGQSPCVCRILKDLQLGPRMRKKIGNHRGDELIFGGTKSRGQKIGQCNDNALVGKICG